MHNSVLLVIFFPPNTWCVGYSPASLYSHKMATKNNNGCLLQPKIARDPCSHQTRLKFECHFPSHCSISRRTQYDLQKKKTVPIDRVSLPIQLTSHKIYDWISYRKRQRWNVEPNFQFSNIVWIRDIDGNCDCNGNFLTKIDFSKRTLMQ